MKQFISSSTLVSANNNTNSIFLVSVVLCLFASAMLAAQEVSAMPSLAQLDQMDQSSGKPSVALAVVENPELVARVLENLLRNILISQVDFQPLTNGAQKRGLDLGISRGFSGSQAGKHLMGLSAASFANGPGRR